MMMAEPGRRGCGSKILLLHVVAPLLGSWVPRPDPGPTPGTSCRGGRALVDSAGFSLSGALGKGFCCSRTISQCEPDPAREEETEDVVTAAPFNCSFDLDPASPPTRESKGTAVRAPRAEGGRAPRAEVAPG